jgi:hypothetical protein
MSQPIALSPLRRFAFRGSPTLFPEDGESRGECSGIFSSHKQGSTFSCAESIGGLLYLGSPLKDLCSRPCTSSRACPSHCDSFITWVSESKTKVSVAPIVTISSLVERGS